MTRMEEMVACLTTTSLEGQCETSDKFPSCSKSMQKKKKKKWTTYSRFSSISGKKNHHSRVMLTDFLHGQKDRD